MNKESRIQRATRIVHLMQLTDTGHWTPCDHKGDYTGEYVDIGTVNELLEALRDLTFQAEPYHVISTDRAESAIKSVQEKL